MTDSTLNQKLIKSYSYSMTDGLDTDGNACKIMTIFIKTLDEYEDIINDITIGFDLGEDYIKEACEETLENYGYRS